ncbi:MAG: hypothetical protein EAX95_10655 [Candidatus Thorarchaeota archaeon]|nr:hypothetical protein [Candidatus Thorarchaeota archaeon]
MVMDENKLREMCLRVMDDAWPAYLTTIDERGYPQTRAMFNLRNKQHFPKLEPLFLKLENRFTAIFSTNTSSTKIDNITKDSKVSIYYCVPDEWRGVMLSGNIEIVDDAKLKKALWHDGWERYYPKGYDDPDHSVLRLEPILARGWNQNHTFRLDLGEEE